MAKDKFERFFNDVDKAYKDGIACPVKKSFYEVHNQKQYGCALTAAYLVNGNKIEDPDDDEVGDTVDDWARKHYGFTSDDIGSLIFAFDYGKGKSRKEGTEATAIGLKLRSKYRPVDYTEVRCD